MSRYWRTENEDGTFTNEKCYTPADMEAFAEWVDNHYTVESITGKQLREMWEKERFGNDIDVTTKVKEEAHDNKNNYSR